jgi:hypothetical protein
VVGSLDLKEFVDKFQQTEQVERKLIGDLRAIKGYTEIAVIRGGPEETFS